MWNNAERLRDKWLETVREAQADATAHIENNTYDSDAQERFQRKFDQGVEFRKEAEELEARNAAAGAHAMRTLENFYGGGAPAVHTDSRTVPAGVSLFEQRQRQGWTRPGDADFARLTPGQFFRAAVTGRPRSEAEERALSESVNASGGFWVPEPLALQLIDNLRNVSSVSQAGARFVPLESESLAIARLESDPSFSWVGEASTGATTDPAFGQIQLVPKKLFGVVKASAELVEDAINLEQALQRSFVGAMAAELDRVALFGESTSSEPSGLWGSTSIGTVNLATGSTATGVSLTNYDGVVDATQQLQEANVRGSRLSAIMAPRSFAEYGKLKDTSNQPMARPPVLDNVAMIQTNSVRTDLTFASTGQANNGTALFVGAYEHLWVGMRFPASMIVLQERFRHADQIGFVARMRVDLAREYDGAFTVVKGIHASTL